MDLQALRLAVRSDTCVIVGNGPSLQPETVAAIAADSADVFISNFAFENAALFARANLLGIVNPLVAEQAADGLAETYAAAAAAGQSTPELVLPASLVGQMPAGTGAFGIAEAQTPGFQTHESLGASTQSTVTYFLLQLAFWIGYKRVTLVGVDNSYQQPDVAEGEVINQVDADTNHFASDYFQGRRWQAADTSRMAAVIALAARAYTKHGRLLTNSTEGGALEVLPRVRLDDALKRAVPGAAPIALAPGRAFVLQLWSRLLRLRSRRLLAVVGLSAVLLWVAALVLRSSVALVGAGLGALLGAVIIAIGLWARHTEIASLRAFEQLSRTNPSSPQSTFAERK